jgi:hypothetical protein
MWHVVAESYMDPVAFRRSLNLLIPEIRNISFLIQKLKSSYANFDDWYPRWQRQARDNRVMRWIVASRNRVVKEGDLDLMSRMSARLQLNWIAEAEMEFDVPPRTTTAELLDALLQTRPPEGLLTVRRSWRDFALSGYELLSALAEAWENCSRLVVAAHEGLPTGECFDDAGWSRTCVVSELEAGDAQVCIRESRDYYEMALDLAEMKLHGTHVHMIDINDDNLAELARKQFGELPTPPPGDAIQQASFFLEIGMAILRAHESLLMTAHFFVGNRRVDMRGFVPEDHVSVMRTMDQIAERVQELQADSVVVSSETWLAAYDEKLPGVRPGDRTDRFEALCVESAASDGRVRTLLRRFTRDAENRAVFDEDTQIISGAPFSLEPLRKVWAVKGWRGV